MTKSVDHRYQGEIGQKLAEALLLRFLTPARPEPDSGIDAVGHLRMESDESVCFNFQFKTGEFVVKTETFRKWTDLVEHEPVILLHIEIPSVQRQEYRFLILHDWMLKNPERPRRVARQKTVSFAPDAFHQVGPTADNFHRALTTEADRIRAKPSALWHTRRSLWVPIREVDLFHHFGHLGAFEIPAGAVQEASNVTDENKTASAVWGYLRDLWSLPGRYPEASRLPKIRAWLDEILRPRDRDREQHERKQFQRFVRAMQDVGCAEALSIPGFTYDEISCWRVFTQLFPQSLCLLKQVSEHPSHYRPDQLMAVSLLSSNLATADDQVIAGRAHDTLTRLFSVAANSRAYRFQDYAVIRQLYFAMAEAHGDLESVNRVVNFIHRHPATWDLRLTRAYSRDNTDGALARSVMKKIECPKPRDVNTRRISEFLLDRLPKGIVDAVLVPMHAKMKNRDHVVVTPRFKKS
jgi:hypothetical protein